MAQRRLREFPSLVKILVRIIGKKVRRGQWEPSKPDITMRPGKEYLIDEDCFVADGWMEHVPPGSPPAPPAPGLLLPKTQPAPKPAPAPVTPSASTPLFKPDPAPVEGRSVPSVPVAPQDTKLRSYGSARPGAKSLKSTPSGGARGSSKRSNP